MLDTTHDAFALSSAALARRFADSVSQHAVLIRVQAERATLEEVQIRLKSQLARSGLRDVELPRWPQNFTLKRDPYDGEVSLCGEWRSRTGAVIGSLVIHETGQLHAELDVIRPVPGDEHWIVEAVTAFGFPGALQTELRLLPAPT